MKTFSVTTESRQGKFWLMVYMNRKQITKFDISGKSFKERTEIQTAMAQTLYLINA